MTYDTDDSPVPTTRSWMGRANDLRASKPYRTGTLMASAALLAVIALWAGYTALTGVDSAPGTQVSPGISAQPSAQSLPTASGAVPAPQFAAPTSDRHGRRVETPVNPLGQVLPQRQPVTAATDISAAPEGLMWQRVYGAILPFSTGAGPTVLGSDGVPGGYAHTAQGAAIAALQISGRLIAAPREQVRELIERAVVVQGDGARAIADRALTLAPTESEVASLYVVPIAMKVTNYADDYAHVALALQMPDTAQQKGIVATRADFDMVWRDGTWKMVMPAGAPDRNTLLMTSLDPNWRAW